MHRFITACLALAAFAAFMIAPSLASASNTPTLTVPTGTDAAVGTKIVGTAGTTKLLNTEGGTILECASATMTGELTKNSGGNVEGTITSSTFVGDGPLMEGEPDKECTGFVSAAVTATTPWCLRSTTTMKTDEFQVRGGKCSEAAKPIVFHMVTTGFGTCTYERAAASPVIGTFKTHPEAAVLTVTSSSAGSGFSKVAGSFFCPASGYLQMSFTLENETGSTAYIDS